MSFLDLFAKLSLDSSEYERGLDNAQKMAGGIGGKIGSGLRTATKIAGGALAGATTAVVGFGKTAVDAGMSFDSSMSQVAATMGLTMDEMEGQIGATETTFGHFEGTLRDFAQYMGSNTAFSATEAADALNYMALAGYDAQTSMEMLPNVLSLAAAGGFDLARASDMITDTQTAFGISLERTSLMVDEMAKAASTGNTSVEQLGDAFLVVGGLAQELNGGMVTLADGTERDVDGIQELEIALTAMANAGVKGSEAGTHMRNMLLKLSSPTDDGAAALESLGVAVFDTEGNMRSLQDIFGDMKRTMDGDVGPALENFYNKFAGMSDEAILKEFEKTPEDFEFLGTSILDSTGKLRDFNDVVAEFENGIRQKRKIKLVSDIFNARDIASAEALLNAINQDWDAIGESILEAEGAASEMAETQLDNLTGDVTLFQSALEGARIAVSDNLTPTLRDFVQLGTQGLSDVTMAFKEGGLSGAMEAVGGWLSDVINKITEAVPQIVRAGGEVLVAFIEGMAENVPQLSNAVVSIVSELGNVLITTIPTLAQAGYEFILSLAQSFGTALPEMAAAAQEMIGQLVVGIRDNLPQIIQSGLETAKEFSGSLRENVGMMVDSALELILALGQGLIDSLPAIIQNVPEIVSNIAGIINDNAPKILAAGVKLIIALVQGIIESIPIIVLELPKIIAAIWDVFTAINWVNLGSSVINGIKNGITSMGNSLAEAGKSLVDRLKTNFINLPQAFMDIGANLIQGLIDGIKGFLPSLLSHVGEIATSVISSIKSFFGIHSPSTVFDGIGQNLMAGLGNGIINGAKAVIENAKRVASDVLGAIKGFFGIHSPSSVMDEEVGQMIGKGEAQGMRKMIPEIRSAAEEMSDVATEGAMAEISVARPAMVQSGGDGRIERLLVTMIDMMKEARPITIDSKMTVGYFAPLLDTALGQIMDYRQREAAL